MHDSSATVDPDQIRALFNDGMGIAQLRDSSTDHTHVIDPMPRRRTPGLKVAGPAFPVATDDDMLPCIQALAAAPAESVLYFHNIRTPSEALAGDILVTAARSQRLAGLVVHGAVRDLDALAELQFPVFSTEVNYVSAKTAKVPAATVPSEVDSGGARIRPGDWLFGDGDGVVLVEREFLSPVVKAAKLLQQTEDEFRGKLDRGELFSELCGLDDFLAGRGQLRFDA